MKKREIEVLAPAGSMECLRAAVLNGADAVYLGGEMFGARAYAGNFKKEELCEAIDYAHIFGKKIFLTINTLVKETESRQLIEFLIPYYEQGLDAVIIQDPGVIRMVREHFPDLEIHASTQMTVTGVNSARLVKRMGAKRVVPARELSLEEIREIKEAAKMDIECFVHGALCYCYSGQCFMSSMLGGRSGNRGRCAGTCRLPFYGKDSGKNKYLLSLKDLCTIEQLPEILDHGVDSLKIEGRMKGARYVGEVTRIYRKYVDLYLSGKEYKVDPQDKKILMELFNRGGFTDGYYNRYHGRDMMSMERPDHQGILIGKIQSIKKGTLSFTSMEKIHKGDVLQIRTRDEENIELTSPSDWEKGDFVTLNGQKMKKLSVGMKIMRTRNMELVTRIDGILQQKKKEKLKGKVTLCPGRCAKLWIEDGEISVSAEGPVIEEAKKHGARADEVRRQLEKTGETHYEFQELEVELSGQAFVPGSVLKKLRREAFSRMDEEKTGRYWRQYRRMEPDTVQEDKPSKDREARFSVSLESLELLDTVLNHPKVEDIYLPWRQLKQEADPEHIVRRVTETGRKCYLMLPQIARRQQIKELDQAKSWILSEKIDGLIIRNLEEYGWALEAGYGGEMILDYMMYAYNRKAVMEYKEYARGDVRMTYPEECSLEEMEELNPESADLLIYGYLPLMVSAQCVKENLHRCDGREQWMTIQDRYRKKFFVHSCCSDCVNEIYNGQPLWLGGEIEAVCRRLRPKAYRVHLTKETPKEAELVLKAAEEVWDGKDHAPVKDYTKGHFRRGAL